MRQYYNILNSVEVTDQDIHLHTNELHRGVSQACFFSVSAENTHKIVIKCGGRGSRVQWKTLVIKALWVSDEETNLISNWAFLSEQSQAWEAVGYFRAA